MALKKKKTTTNKELDEKLKKLRETKQWQNYFKHLSPSWSKLGIKPEQGKRYIDKLVLNKVDRKNPMKSFDEFWKNI